MASVIFYLSVPGLFVWEARMRLKRVFSMNHEWEFMIHELWMLFNFFGENVNDKFLANYECGFKVYVKAWMSF